MKKILNQTIRLLALMLPVLLFVVLCNVPVAYASSGDREAYVTRLYQLCLNREPDPVGFSTWVSQLQKKKITWGTATYGFVFSNELKRRNINNQEFVTILYRVMLNREPAPSEVSYWVQRIKGRNGRINIFRQFEKSKEFKNLCTQYNSNSPAIPPNKAPAVTIQYDEISKEGLETMPFKLVISIADQRVYAFQKVGDSIRLAREMICSTGTVKNPTILGTFIIPQDNSRNVGTWYYFSEYKVYARYFRRINGGYLFHSVLFLDKKLTKLSQSSVTSLGKRASHGCIRLSVADAQWIYENIRGGTRVEILEKTVKHSQ